MQPTRDIWKAGSGHCTSAKAPWLELQTRAGQTPEHGAMKLSAAVRETQASPEVFWKDSSAARAFRCVLLPLNTMGV